MDQYDNELEDSSALGEGKSILYAQVMKGKPKMAVNEEGFLEIITKNNKNRSIYLGDVAKSVMQALGAYDKPSIIGDSNWDEQVWNLECKSNDLIVKISEKKNFDSKIIKQAEQSYIFDKIKTLNFYKGNLNDSDIVFFETR